MFSLNVRLFSMAGLVLVAMCVSVPSFSETESDRDGSTAANFTKDGKIASIVDGDTEDLKTYYLNALPTKMADGTMMKRQNERDAAAKVAKGKAEGTPEQTGLALAQAALEKVQLEVRAQVEQDGTIIEEGSVKAGTTESDKDGGTPAWWRGRFYGGGWGLGGWGGNYYAGCYPNYYNYGYGGGGINYGYIGGVAYGGFGGWGGNYYGGLGGWNGYYGGGGYGGGYGYRGGFIAGGGGYYGGGHYHGGGFGGGFGMGFYGHHRI